MGGTRLIATQPGDLLRVVEWEREAGTVEFIIPWKVERHAAALQNADIDHLMVATDAGTVGFVILAGLRDPNESVEFRRIVIAEKGRGRGHGRAAVRAVIQRAFGELRAHRLWLDVKVNNLRARRLYESEGFRYEGILRECLKGPRGFESLALMSLLSSEWESGDRV